MKRHNKQCIGFLLACVLSAIVAGCMGNLDIFDITLEDGTVVSERSVTISWKEKLNPFQFLYKLDEGSWISTSDTSVTLHDLSEGEHVFQVLVRNDADNEQGEPMIVQFEVDTIGGPGLILSPRRIDTEGPITLTLEDVESVMAIHVEIIAENDCAIFDSFSKNPAITENVTVIAISESITPGRMSVDVAFAGNSKGVSGRMDIGSFMVVPSGEGVIRIESTTTRCRDTENRDIVLSAENFDWVNVLP
jgi:hypothetical protein